MNSRRVYTLLGILLFLTFLDIIVVDTWYRPTQDWDNIWKYHIIYWTLIITLPLLVAYKTKDSTPLLTYVLFLFGIEDTLFYLFQGYLPNIFYGVSFLGVIVDPSLFTGLIINFVGATTCLALLSHGMP